MIFIASVNSQIKESIAENIDTNHFKNWLNICWFAVEDI